VGTKRLPATFRLRETDLYGPLRDYLIDNGYTVRSEVKGCDVTATRGEELVVVEMKCGFTIDLLLQATQRQRVADSVYVAVPRPRARDAASRRWTDIRHLLRRLEIGLIFVAAGRDVPPLVEVVFHPVPAARRRSPRARRAILQEIAGRSGDYNRGGSTGCRLVTAYREQAVFIARCLERHGPLTPRALRGLGACDKAQNILWRDVYGWFERQGLGVYGLGSGGRSALGDYPDLVAHCDRVLESRADAGYRTDAAPPETPPAAAAAGTGPV
jgi:hypothetical protein